MKLTEKLLEIQKACNYFKKEAEGYQFQYVSGDQILSVVRPKMDELGVLLITEVVDSEIKVIESPKFRILTTLKLNMVWTNAADGARIVVPWVAQGLKDTEQGIGSALTYSERYFLLKQFKVPTSVDDPDHWDKKHGKPEPVETKEEMDARIAKEKLAKQKKSIDAFIAKNPDFKVFLIGEGMDPDEIENIPLIFENSRTLKAKFEIWVQS